MHKHFYDKIISVILALVMLVSAPAVLVRADDEAPGKYVSDVMIAYGNTRDEANKWLTDNGWEPISGDNDFTAGKNSSFDSAIVTAMGIKRTDNAKEAITDMAVMNMNGGYSLPDYESLLNEKKAQIDEFINNFMVVIQEYRDNYNGKGSEFGKTRAEAANRLLNKFLDGEENGSFAVNDTFRSLGDLLLEPTRQEGNDSGADLEQIMLESGGAAMVAVETLLAMAADNGEETWIERLKALSGDDLAENLSKYVPEANGQDLAPSAVTGLLKQHYGDTARILAEEWDKVHEYMTDYEAFNEYNGLWQKEGESDEAYAERINEVFSKYKEIEPDQYEAVYKTYNDYGTLYVGLYDIEYAGSWGETLGDFFNPADGSDYGKDADLFLPMAAALSKGQRASLDFLSLISLLRLGLGTQEAFEQVTPDINSLFDGAESISIYTGVNRAAFRGGVAITSQALMDQNMGKGSAFDRLWDNTGIAAIAAYSAAVISVAGIVAGAAMWAKGYRFAGNAEAIARAEEELAEAQRNLNFSKQLGNQFDISWHETNLKNAQTSLDVARGDRVTTSMGTAGRWMVGAGGALLIGAAVFKAVQMYKYYERTFTPIPLMIVDESDIVTFITDEAGNPVMDEAGNQKRNIQFNTYEYYEAVKCNRQEFGERSDWQNGVEAYKENGCGDIADLNGDFGQEWLALYTVRSENKGNPILADSLKLQYGSDVQPEGTDHALHLFEYTHAMDLGDTAYSYNNDKGGVYFFWGADENASPAASASAFSSGNLAMVGAIGLAVGILAATFFLLPKRKKMMEE